MAFLCGRARAGWPRRRADAAVTGRVPGVASSGGLRLPITSPRCRGSRPEVFGVRVTAEHVAYETAIRAGSRCPPGGDWTGAGGRIGHARRHRTETPRSVASDALPRSRRTEPPGRPATRRARTTGRGAPNRGRGLTGSRGRSRSATARTRCGRPGWPPTGRASCTWSDGPCSCSIVDGVAHRGRGQASTYGASSRLVPRRRPAASPLSGCRSVNPRMATVRLAPVASASRRRIRDFLVELEDLLDREPTRRGSTATR